MCHILLFMPLLGLPLFWIMPLSEAIPIYTVIVLFSGLLYWFIWKAMRLPPLTGPESIIGTDAEVISRLSPGHLAQYLVRARGELWSAHCTDTLQPGEKVKVADLSGINLIVKPRNKAILNDEISKTGERENYSKVKKCHCH